MRRDHNLKLSIFVDALCCGGIEVHLTQPRSYPSPQRRSTSASAALLPVSSRWPRAGNGRELSRPYETGGRGSPDNLSTARLRAAVWYRPDSGRLRPRIMQFPGLRPLSDLLLPVGRPPQVGRSAARTALRIPEDDRQKSANRNQGVTRPRHEDYSCARSALKG